MLRTGQKVVAKLKDLPRFQPGQLITARQLQEIPRAINAREAASGFPQTAFKAFKFGQAITAGDLNQFIKPLTRLGHHLGFTTHLTNFPLKPGDLITAAILNQIIDAINALSHRL